MHSIIDKHCNGLAFKVFELDHPHTFVRSTIRGSALRVRSITGQDIAVDVDIRAPVPDPDPCRVYPCAKNESALHLLRGGVPAGDEAPDDAPGDAVLAESTGRLARAVQARYHLAPDVLHLEVRVDAQAGAGIMSNRRGPAGVERRRLDFVLGSGFVEIRVRARSTKEL